ncbi:hypothetical protein GGP51_003097 [Salinibacter ruber]|nr:hypothetical protein [Salinibacter ruber]
MRDDWPGGASTRHRTYAVLVIALPHPDTHLRDSHDGNPDSVRGPLSSEGSGDAAAFLRNERVPVVSRSWASTH